MFKPPRILQATLITIAAAGCAARPTPHQTSSLEVIPSVFPNQLVTGAPPAPSAATVVIKNLPEPASIPAGSSLANRQTFFTPDGQLQADIQLYAQDVARVRQVPLALVEQILLQANYNVTAAKLMRPSKGRIKKSWVTYKQRNVDPVRLERGVKFWRTHQRQLDNISQQYGVPPSVIVSILGIETVYGNYMGDFKVLDALFTLGFAYPDDSRPERGQLFRDQLADLIELHHQGELNALSVEGSFAGAMGMPQFMPGSLMRYAVDGDGDGTIDLRGNPVDVIASVANFLRAHGWQPSLPVFAPVDINQGSHVLLDGGIDPKRSWTEFQQVGAKIAGQADNSGDWTQYKVGLVNLVDEPRGTVEWRLGTPNFFAITHYNRSYFYAAAVADLASALARQMGYGGPN